MPDDQDFRSDKCDSVEGGGVAVARWRGYHHNLDEDVLAEAFSTPAAAPEKVFPGIAEQLAAQAMERSELIGFWVAWHLAGGSAHLEQGGWHRATIFRKIRRFRASFGAHPDEYEFPWITLDLRAAWSEEIERRIEESRRRGF
ncbi:MAG TPA: hypothetical protein VL961_05195 [Acidimicrobiales bacterium]|nr:hypothetical protein [Acidimicrobiales bacterium]